MKRIVRGVAQAAGEDPRLFGAHSGRIGGATDYRDWAGAERGKRVLTVFGRWRGDIEKIYTRFAVEEALDASAGVADVRSRELEAVFAGFTEPGTR